MAKKGKGKVAYRVRMGNVHREQKKRITEQAAEIRQLRAFLEAAGVSVTLNPRRKRARTKAA